MDGLDATSRITDLPGHGVKHMPHTMTPGYLGTRIVTWQVTGHGRLSLVLLLFVILNFCISRAADLKSGIPTLTPADIKTFQLPDVKYYRYLNLDERNKKLYIGAMNYMIRINNIDDISTFDYSKTDILNKSDEFNIDQAGCKSAQTANTVDFECQNHIRSVIPLADGNIQICGTSAYNPRIFILKSNRIGEEARSLFSKSVFGKAVCPPSPNATCNVIYVQRGNPGNQPATYSGTMMDFTTAYPVIYRPAIQPYSNLLRTERADTKWLNEPYFVQSFDVDEHVYFFFRENAIEYMNCGKAIYSRVARVCKSDRGGREVLKNRFTTYFKARLNCSIPGNYPFYFNELYDVFRIGNTFFGLFRTYKDGLFGSAICAFTQEEIQKAFNGPFKEQKESTSIWQSVPDSRVPNPRPGQCNVTSTEISDSIIQFSKARPLMDLSVQMDKGQPVLYIQQVMYEKMVIVQRNNFNIYMLIADDGSVHKVLSWDDGVSYHHKVIAVWNNFTDNNQIHQLKLHNDNLYLSTDDRIIQMPIKQCSRYIFCTQCIQDPDCGWNDRKMKCQDYRDGLRQNVTASIPEVVCKNVCRAENADQQVRKVYGDSVHLNCASFCEPSSEIQWLLNNVNIAHDEKKYFLTVNNGLIVFNLTRADSGKYTCTSHGITLKEHSVAVTECQSIESCWRNEFSRWCTEFDNYLNELEDWKKLKNQCTSKNYQQND